MKQVKVELGELSYPICIGNSILSNQTLIKPFVTDKQVLIVSDETVAPLYLDTLEKNLIGLEVNTFILTAGESAKNLGNFERIIGWLIEKRYDRTCTLIALGGGVVGDLTGFVAACYQRGVGFIQIPTTLLAQVDSSVGGKTAVNHPLGKNMIGAFYQPLIVIADTGVLATLPTRELSAGLAEVIKYGLICDRAFFDWLEDNIEALLKRDESALTYAIERSCINKAEVVAADERESGLRAILNLGHTFGHAIETALSYKEWLHGEAVACGMLMAADLSVRLGILDISCQDRISALLEKAALPVRIYKNVSLENMLHNMKIDKKSRGGLLYLILLKDIGDAVITADYSQEALVETINHFLQ